MGASRGRVRLSPSPDPAGRRPECDPRAARRPVHRRCWLALLLTGLLAGLWAGPAGVDGPAAARAQSGPIGYRLVEDWSERAWIPRPGRYGHAADISATADGWRYILDRRQQALHILTVWGEPRARLDLRPWLPGPDWEARRLDGAGSALALLLGDGDSSQVLELDLRQGRLLGARVRLELPLRYNDLARHPDGRLLLSRSIPRIPVTPEPRDRGPGPKGGVDLYAADGRFLAALDDRPLFYPIGVDFGPEGAPEVINRVPVPSSEGPPGPPATPEPSLARDPRSIRDRLAGTLPELALDPNPRGSVLAGAAGAASPAWGAAPLQDAPAPVAGLVRYDGDLAWRESWPFNAAEDLAAGPAGVFLSRQMEIFALGQDEPLWSGPTGQVIWPYSGGAPLHLEAADSGPPLQASLAHCYSQGLLGFASTRPGSPPRRVFGLDDPPLSGPWLPLRIAAGALPATLQGRFARSGQQTLLVERPPEPQSVQRWSTDGRLRDQLGICGGLAVPWQVDVSRPWWARDLAVDGQRVYTIDAMALRARPEDGFPEWSAWPDLSDPSLPEPDQLAVDARAGRVAVLDGGRRELRLHDAAGDLLARWPLDAPELVGPSLPMDLALGAAGVYLADSARRRVLAYDLEGRLQAVWALHDSPAAISVDDAERLYILGHGGWAWRYTSDGRLDAFWRLPGPWATDIAAGPNGRVYLSYARRERLVHPHDRPLEAVQAAGVWVYEPEDSIRLPEPDPDGCRMLPDKRAAPQHLLLGQEVEVGLRVEGDCPGRYRPTDLAILIDASRSMSFDSALERAREALRDLVERIDNPDIRWALLRFESEAAIAAPMGAGPAELLTAAARIQPRGDTRLGEGMFLAAQHLSEGEADRERRLLVLTDGEYKDSLAPALDALGAADVQLDILIYPISSFDRSMAANLERVVGRPGSVRVEPGAESLAELAGQFGGYRPQPRLFESLTVHDEIPRNMRYVEDSARPPAAWDPDRRRLTWRLESVESATGLSLGYRVEPLEPGRWPTNLAAWTEHVDGLGRAGRLDFPLPRVDVLTRQDLSRRVYLPFGARRDCLRSARPVDLVLAIDSSRSMAEPAAGGGSKLEAAGRAAKGLIERLTPGRDRVAVLGFDQQLRSLIGLSGDLERATTALDDLVARPGTRIDLGLAGAAEILSAEGRSDATRAVILLSDGRQPGGEEAARSQAERLDAIGALRYTIALGPDADLDLLVDLAGSPTRAYRSPEAEDLAVIYAELARRVGCGEPPEEVENAP